MMVWKCPSGPSLLPIAVGVYRLFLNIIALNWSECARSLIHHLIIFLCPQLIWILFVFLLRIHCIAPRSVEKNWCHFCQEFANLVDVFLLKIFLILESNLTFQRSCLFKSDCWNEIREMSIFESIFGNQALLVKDPTHAIQCNPLIVLYFLEKRNWLVVRLKWLFPWFFVSILNSNFGYIFWLFVIRWPFMNFKKNKVPESKLEA